MPLFYFHVCNGTGFVEDEEGTDLADLAAAGEFAVRCARDIMAADVQRGALDLSSFIEIVDVDHRLVRTLGFDQAVDLTTRH